MLFNSISFAIFLPIVFIGYWFVFQRKLKLQNLFVLVSSYLFYGWWDWRFLFLIFISSLTDYLIGIHLYKSQIEIKRKMLLWLSLFVNLGLLGFFKYFNFFIDSLTIALSQVGIEIHTGTLNIILPVGISFYTFQTLSYTIDIYRKKLIPVNDIIAFFAFVSFFPQLVAGPIERAKNLLPQFEKKRVFNYEEAADGMRQILWGLFKKIVIADNCGKYADFIFANYDSLTGSTLVLGALYFAFQIYCDFSGYSDIAIGTAKLFGIRIMRNFAYPYFSRDIAEFWRRWHISLSTWFRDYVYIPLGGSRGSKLFRIRNILITFTLSGLWHGANWTFVFWGLLNGLFYIPLMLFDRQKQNTGITAEGRRIPSVGESFKILITFFITLMAWVFFRATDIGHAFGYLSIIFSESLLRPPRADLTNYLSYIAALVLIEWFQRNKSHALQMDRLRLVFRWLIYILIIFAIIFYGVFDRKEFIYFQF